MTVTVPEPVRLRICYVVPGFCADDRDWCIPVLRNFVAEMARHHDVSVYTPHYPYHRSTYHAAGATVHCFSNRKEQGVRRILLWKRVSDAIAADHAARPFDVVHAFWATDSGLIAVHAARRIGVPCVVSIGGGELARFPAERYGSQLSVVHRTIVKRSFAGAAAVTGGSRWVLAKVPERYAGRLHLMPLGVDTAMFVPGTLRTGRRLLAVSSMIALKNHGTLLQAVAQARRVLPDITLDIAGDGVEREAIAARVDALGLRDIVRFLGDVPYDAMPELFRNADLLLHASRYESQGMVILEALASGLPVVVSDVGIAAELPEDLVYRFDPCDASAMAGRIIESLGPEPSGPESSGTHARQALQAGPSLVQDRFSLGAVRRVCEELYRSLPKVNA